MSIPPTDPSMLVSLAEISVALAGFSSIVVLFRQRDSGTWHEQDADRFHGMVIHAMVATFFCFVPTIMGALTHDARLAWTSSSVLLGLQILGHVTQILRLASTDPKSRAFLLVGIGVAILLLSSAAGFGPSSPIEAFFVGIIWHVFQAGVLFVWLIWIPTSRIESS